MGVLGDFLSNGQERRRWIEGKGQEAADALSYYLGPGVNVNALAQIADMFNPVGDMTRAGTAARGVVRPGATAMERVNALGNVATDMASVLAPVAGAAYADDAARGLTEALANWSMPADDAVGRFAMGEDGGLRLFHGSDARFDEFDMNAPVSGGRSLGRAMYLTPDPQDAAGYGRYVYEYDVDGVNPLVARTSNYNFNVSDDYADYLRQQGHDSLITRLIDKDDAGNIASEYDYEMALYDPSKARLAKVYDTFYQSYVDELAGIEPTRVLPFDEAGKLTARSGANSTEMAGSSPAPASTRNPSDISGVDNAGISAANVAGGPVLSPAETAGQNVLDLLTAGRASEVTDDMLDLGDPVLNARLNDYLFRNYDLPMDEASRMARAREMGFDTETPLYHGGTSNLKAVSRFDGTAEAGQDGLFSTSSPRVANTYAKSRSMADAGMGGHNVTPLYGRTGDYRQAGYTVPFPADGTDAEVNAWMAGLDRFNRRLDADGAKPAYFQSQADAARAAGQPGAVIREVEDNRIASGFVEPSDVYMTLDPTSVRSRFARFDPRLAHLRNLSAGVGGLGIALGLQPSEEQELRAYLQQ